MAESNSALIPAGFVTGLASFFIGVAVDVIIETLTGLLISLGIAGAFGIFMMAAIHVNDEVQTIMKIIIGFDWLYMAGLLCGLFLLNLS